MPGTASTSTSSRSTLASRSSTSNRPKLAAPLAPVLLRLPTIQQLADFVPANPISPTEIVASAVVALEPSVATAQVVASPIVQSASASSNHTAEATQPKARQARSWWEHWSSGIVLVILLLTLIAAAVMALTDSSNGDAETLASETDARSGGERSEEGMESLSNIEVPEISFGAPLEFAKSSPEIAKSDSTDKSDSAVEAGEKSTPATPFAQVSRRTSLTQPSTNGSQASEQPATQRPENTSGSPTLGIPAPIDSSSNAFPSVSPMAGSGLATATLMPPAFVLAPSNSFTHDAAKPTVSPHSTTLNNSPAASPGSSSAGDGVSQLELSAALISAPPLASTGRVDIPKLPNQVSIPPAVPQSIPANLATYSVPAPQKSDATKPGEVAGLKSATASATIAKPDATSPASTLSQPPVGKPIAMTSTPNSDIEQLIRKRQEFSRLQKASAATEMSNRYSPALGNNATTSTIPAPQPASIPVR